jgi:hypothetical protein
MARLSAQGQALANPQSEESARNNYQRFSPTRAVGAVPSTAEVLVEESSCNRLNKSREMEEDGKGQPVETNVPRVLAQVSEMAVANLPTVSAGPF